MQAAGQGNQPEPAPASLDSEGGLDDDHYDEHCDGWLDEAGTRCHTQNYSSHCGGCYSGGSYHRSGSLGRLRRSLGRPSGVARPILGISSRLSLGLEWRSLGLVAVGTSRRPGGRRRSRFALLLCPTDLLLRAAGAALLLRSAVWRLVFLLMPFGVVRLRPRLAVSRDARGGGTGRLLSNNAPCSAISSSTIARRSATRRSGPATRWAADPRATRCHKVWLVEVPEDFGGPWEDRDMLDAPTDPNHKGTRREAEVA